MDGNAADAVVRAALAMRAAQDGAQALLVLDIAFRHHHGAQLNFDRGGPRGGSWLRRRSPFARLLTEAFAPDWREPADSVSAALAWDERVLQPFVERYRLRLVRHAAVALPTAHQPASGRVSDVPRANATSSDLPRHETSAACCTAATVDREEPR